MTSFVGIDLAWGERARTGLAVLDDSGALVASASLRSDDEICAWLGAVPPGPVVAAIDAPLVVTNAAGRRSCEADVQRLFGRYGASAYPANLGNPCFANGTRGARLCARLGWDLDPRSAAPRRAVEVYPHPAMVALFGLDRVIPYKNKRGRSVESLRAAFAMLLGSIEQALGAELRLAGSPRWAGLRAVAAGATRKYELGRIEDEVDAIVCAYLARYWSAYGEARNHLLGDVASGYIVTPRLRTDNGGGPSSLGGATAGR